MELVLQQKQTLNLVMTAELRQAIDLLQYSTYDLYQFIQEQQAENPLIELINSDQDSYTYHPVSQATSDAEDDSNDPLALATNDDKNLYDELLAQLNVLSLSDEQYELIHYFIQNIDENGYLQINEAEVEKIFNRSIKDIESAIEILQQFEPIGVGARHLAECLTIQAKHFYPDQSILIKIIQNDLTELANREWEAIAKRYDISLEDIQDYFLLIQTLDPKPGARLANNQVEYVEPDVIITYDHGKFSIQLNDSYLPAIRLNKDYLPYLNKQHEMSQYMNHQYKKFQWLKNSIAQRRETILKITKAIINHQVEFFEGGFARLKPLTLKDVAEEIEMHESSVSRATMNKMIQTPKGTFNMRRLFASRLSRTDGTETSQTTVKWLLQDVVNNEDKTKPLSDQKIADYLKEKKEITISRRTVAKYRNELKIPSSRQRREIVLQKN